MHYWQDTANKYWTRFSVSWTVLHELIFSGESHDHVTPLLRDRLDWLDVVNEWRSHYACPSIRHFTDWNKLHRWHVRFTSERRVPSLSAVFSARRPGCSTNTTISWKTRFFCCSCADIRDTDSVQGPPQDSIVCCILRTIAAVAHLTFLGAFVVTCRVTAFYNCHIIIDVIVIVVFVIIILPFTSIECVTVLFISATYQWDWCPTGVICEYTTFCKSTFCLFRFVKLLYTAVTVRRLLRQIFCLNRCRRIALPQTTHEWQERERSPINLNWSL